MTTASIRFLHNALATIVVNHKPATIVVSFGEAPPAELRSEMKAAGFTYSDLNWTASISDASKALTVRLGQQGAALRTTGAKAVLGASFQDEMREQVRVTTHVARALGYEGTLFAQGGGRLRPENGFLIFDANATAEDVTALLSELGA